jgi:hypothetical protein
MNQKNFEMNFDPENKIVKLCAEGMEMEAKQKTNEAKSFFLKAWNEATNDFEKFIAAHYVARHQDSIEEKLKWDEIALSFALRVEDNSMKTNFPSLYLNIAKCFEDLKDFTNALKNYQSAFSYTNNLADDGYGRMIQSGIKTGIERLSSFKIIPENC